MEPNTDGVIYLDYNATTPTDPRVVQAMDPFQHDLFANAASPHVLGRLARDATEEARERVATLVGARAQEIVFTSGATESNNLALLGTAMSQGRGHIVTAATEHKAVLDVVLAMQHRGYEVTTLVPDSTGWVSADAVAAGIRDDTLLVTIMGANNELGTLSPMSEIGSVCRSRDVLFHSDAAQLAGKLPVDVDSAEVDLLSVSAHKMYGPKGQGALFVRRGTNLSPMIYGGGHERGLRSGTLNVPAIVGFGKAAEIALEDMMKEASRSEELRQLLIDRLQASFPDVEVNGHETQHLPGTLNVYLPGIDADSVQLATPQLAVSSGSACTSATPEPSHVLRAIGKNWTAAQECLRFSFGRFTTTDEIEQAASLLSEGAERLREESPVGATR